MDKRVTLDVTENKKNNGFDQNKKIKNVGFPNDISSSSYIGIVSWTLVFTFHS